MAKNKQNENLLTDIKENPYEILNEGDRACVDMKVNRVPTKFIAKTFKMKDGTIRTWFANGGRLHEAYMFRRKEQEKEYAQLFETIRESIKEGAVEAINTLRLNATKGGMVGVIASKDILDRAGFKPTDKVELESKLPVKVEVTVVKKYDSDKPDSKVQD